MEENIWLKAFTVYQKDPSILRKWIELLKKDFHIALNIAKEYIDYEVIPDALILGFSPQVLVAILAVNYPKSITVITSPEVASGDISAARFSNDVLNLAKKAGLIKEIIVEPLAPSNSISPADIIRRISNDIASIDASIIDISGGTQLAAIAIARTGKKLSYTYPLGDRIKIYNISF